MLGFGIRVLGFWMVQGYKCRVSAFGSSVVGSEFRVWGLVTEVLGSYAASRTFWRSPDTRGRRSDPFPCTLCTVTLPSSCG